MKISPVGAELLQSDMTKLIVALRKFPKTPIKGQFAVYVKVDEFLYIPSDSIHVCFTERNSGMLYYICIIYTPRISTPIALSAGLWAELLTMQCASNENYPLLGYYAASSDNFLPTFRDNLSALSSGVKDAAGNNFLPTFRDNLSALSSGVKDADGNNFLQTFRDNLSALSSGVKDAAGNNFLPTFRDNLCDLETSIMRGPRPRFGLLGHKKICMKGLCRQSFCWYLKMNLRTSARVTCASGLII